MKPEAAWPENTPSYSKLCPAHPQWAVAGQLMLLRPQAVQLCAFTHPSVCMHISQNQSRAAARALGSSILQAASCCNADLFCLSRCSVGN